MENPSEFSYLFKLKIKQPIYTNSFNKNFHNPKQNLSSDTEDSEE